MFSEEDLINLLEPGEIKQRIQADYSRFAPFIALLSAWKGEIDGHVEQIENNVVVRIMEGLFPKGDWRFPAQILAVPEDLVRREVGDEAAFTDRARQTAWTPCGQGWTLPTQIDTGKWSVERFGLNTSALVFEVRMEGNQPNARLVLPPAPPEDPTGQSQLGFVCANEDIVEELSKSDWAVQYPGGAFEPISVSRYRGYLDFENGLAAVRGLQRQLEAWLPPFYPYSRKFLRFYVTGAEAESALDRSAWEWIPAGKQVIRLAVLISERVHAYFRARRNIEPLILNAIPLAQMRTMGDSLVESPDRVGDTHRVPFKGKSNCFAATVREIRNTDGGVSAGFHPAQLAVAPSDDRGRQTGLQDIEVTCGSQRGSLSDYRVRIHYECFGETVSAPTFLSRPNGSRYNVPFPLLGSMDSPVVGYGDKGAKRDWYHALMRAPLLTQADIVEILSQIVDCRNYLDLSSDGFSIQLDIDNEPWVERSAWVNYLWPTQVSEKALLDQRVTFLSKSRVAIVPLMCLVFRRGRQSLPDFLLDDLMDYTASVISRYFMVGWYRVVARLGDV